MPPKHTSSGFPADLHAELITQGFLGNELPVLITGGNLDRKIEAHKSAWRAIMPDGRCVKLTLRESPQKADQADKRPSPSVSKLIPARRFHWKTLAFEVSAEDFIPGEKLSTLIQQGRINPASLDRLLTPIALALRSSRSSSTQQAWLNEWAEWSTALLNLTTWAGSERHYLENQLLPGLRQHLEVQNPETSWVHGDITSENILVDETQRAWLIDLEFSGTSHFHPSEWTRFHLLSSGIITVNPESLWASPTLPWQLFFWLSQIIRENANNQPEFVNNWLPARLTMVSQLSEALFGESTSCPWPCVDAKILNAADGIHCHLEVARWLIDSPLYALSLSGWVHIPNSRPLMAIEAELAGQSIAHVKLGNRPDVHAYFPTDGNALVSGFRLNIPPIPCDCHLKLMVVNDAGEKLPVGVVDITLINGRGPVITGYEAWSDICDPDPPKITHHSSVSFSILLPVYNPPEEYLRACLDSVVKQDHMMWELCVVDDASPHIRTAEILTEFASRDSRIKVQHRTINGGIARATNDALTVATGEYVAFLDHDDVLRPHALSEFAAAIENDPSIDSLYSDEDKITADGKRGIPFLKPAYSPEFLRGIMYVGHFLGVRTSIAKAIGGFDPSYDGIQDYEFMLRVSEITSRIQHIPRILYHWRQSPHSSALIGNVKGDMDRLQAKAVQAHLLRIGDQRRPIALGGHRLKLQTNPNSSVKYEVLTLTDGFTSLAELKSRATASSAPVLLLQTKIPRNEDYTWLNELLALASLPKSGCVAPLILSKEGRILESGCTYANGHLIPIMCGFDPTGDGYNGSLKCNREVVSVSPICVAVKRELILNFCSTENPSWHEFTESIRNAGYQHLVCAASRLTLSLPWLGHGHEIKIPKSAKDPFYNLHFDALNSANYSLASPPQHLPRKDDSLVWHLDSTLASRLNDGCLELQGWCFHLGRKQIKIGTKIAGIEWSVPANQSRPDVAADHQGLTSEFCGFSVRLRVPRGQHQLMLYAQVENGEKQQFLVQPILVPWWSTLNRYFSSNPGRLIAFQLLAGPTHAPSELDRKSIPTPKLTPSNQKLRFSIVTPSYQQAAYLAETISSVLAQNVQCDYVIEDGGSTDGSLEIISSHADKLHAWSSAPDNGQADAIARGFAKTSGQPEDIMGWLNSDDFYLPNALNSVADYFTRNPDIDVVYGHRILVDDQSREIGRWYLPKHNPEVLALNDFVPQETLFWRRRIWDKIGGIDPAFKFAMDWDLLLRFQDAGARMVRVPKFLACFRLHSGQKTTATIDSIGQQEIDELRTRTQKRQLTPAEIVHHPAILHYLRRSVFIEFLWKLGIRIP